MDFRPLGDGMSCVAVAMPRAALEEGTTEAAPGLRRIYAAVGRNNRGWSRDGLPITQTTRLARLSGGSRIRREGAKRVGGGRALASKERRTGRGLSEQASCREEAQGAWCREVSLFVSTLRLCLGGDSQRRQAAGGVNRLPSSSSELLARPCTTPAYNTCPFTTTAGRRRRIAALGPAKLQGCTAA